MTTEELYTLLKTLGIPIAHTCFKHEVSTPYCVYLESRDVHGDDFKNKIIDVQYRIELYTERRDLLLEERIENLLDERGLEYEVDYAEYIASDQTFMTVYEVSCTYKKG